MSEPSASGSVRNVTRGAGARALPRDSEAERGRVDALEKDLASLVTEVRRLRMELAELKAQQKATPRLNHDDASFLIWVLGFTSGANLERDGERGERIFARCREMQAKMFPPSLGINPS